MGRVIIHLIFFYMSIGGLLYSLYAIADFKNTLNKSILKILEEMIYSITLWPKILFK